MLKLSADQQYALDILKAGNNVFLTGDAGTGKSTVINEFCRTTKKQVLRCAPTAVAAQIVEGATLHSVFGIPVNLFEPDSCSNSKKTERLLAVAEIIIIDEISMVRSDILKFIWNTLQNQNVKQIIVVGDFGQLPPVCKTDDLTHLKEMYGQNFESFCFTSDIWQEFEFKTICLHEVHRQTDLEFIKNLQKIKIGDPTAIKYFNSLPKTNDNFGISLVGNNKSADKINNEQLALIENEEVIFNAHVTGKSNVFHEAPAPEKLKLKKGCRVVALKNTYNKITNDLEFANGDVGTIIDIDDEKSIKIEWDNGQISIINEPAQWQKFEYKVEKRGKKKVLNKETVATYYQIPLRLAYAITIHKSQGQSYDKATIYPSCFAEGQLYVALSRVKNVKGLNIKGEIKPEDLIISQKVIDFYVSNGIIENSKKAEKSIEEPKEPLNFQKIKKGRGGARQGAGRKNIYGGLMPGEEIIRIPIPKHLQDQVIAYVKDLLT